MQFKNLLSLLLALLNLLFKWKVTSFNVRMTNISWKLVVCLYCYCIDNRWIHRYSVNLFYLMIPKKFYFVYICNFMSFTNINSFLYSFICFKFNYLVKEEQKTSNLRVFIQMFNSQSKYKQSKHQCLQRPFLNTPDDRKKYVIEFNCH